MITSMMHFNKCSVCVSFVKKIALSTLFLFSHHSSSSAFMPGVTARVYT